MNQDGLRSLRAGESVAVWTHEHIREDVRDLYGFTDDRTHGLFQELLSLRQAGRSTLCLRLVAVS